MEQFILLIINKLFGKSPSIIQFIKFSIIGAINTILDYAVYFGLTRTFGWFSQNYLIANIVSFSAAVTSSYFLNKNWTFKGQSNPGSVGQYIKFITANLVTLGIVELCLYWLVSRLGVFDLYAKILVLIVSVIFNFCFSKFLVFKS